MRAIDPQPVTLSSAFVRLEPLARRHAPELFELGREPELWTWMPRGPFADLGDTEAWIKDGLADENSVAYAIRDLATGRIAGSTRFLDIQRQECGLEIGWTFVGAPFRRTALNTASKRLLFAHAFERLGAERVCLKTDHQNERSQAAILRLGARFEGALRHHRQRRDGTWRDTLYYSVLLGEWPAVSRRLDALLARGTAASD